MNITLGYIDPVAFSLGPIQVRWCGTIIICGILPGYFIVQAVLKQAGLHKDTLIDIILYSAIAGFIVARVYFATFQWPYYMNHLSEIPKIWYGGIAIHGGLIGGLISGIIICKIKNLHPFQIGDIVTPSIILAQGIGRWGNFMNHEAHGGPVSRAFLEHLHLSDSIIRNMYIKGQYYHPTLLYESIWDVIGFVIPITLRKRLKLGETFFGCLIWYSVGRLFVEAMRADSLMLTSHIRVAQLVSVMLITISVIFVIHRRVKYQPIKYEDLGSLTWPIKKAK